MSVIFNYRFCVNHYTFSVFQCERLYGITRRPGCEVPCSIASLPSMDLRLLSSNALIRPLLLFVRQVIISSDWPSADKLTMENWGLGPIQFEGTWYIYLDVYMDGVYFLSKKDWLFTVIGRERIRYYLRVSHI